MPPKSIACETQCDAAPPSVASPSLATAVASPDTGSPARKLYRNLLECVFAFGSFKDLCALLRVSREWSAAVMTMPSIYGAATLSPDHVRTAHLLDRLFSSRLRRHVTELHLWCSERPCPPGTRDPQCTLKLDELCNVAAAMPWMRAIRTYVASPTADAQLLSSALGHLTQLVHLDLSCWYAEAADISLAHTIIAVGRLRHLRTLVLSLRPSASKALSFAPFRDLTQLREFKLDHLSGAPINADGFTQGLKACTEMRKLELSNLPLTSRHLAELLPCWPMLHSLEMRDFRQLDSLRGFAACSPSLLKLLILSDAPQCPAAELEYLLDLRRLERFVIRNLRTPVPSALKSLFDRGPQFPSMLFAEWYHGNAKDPNEWILVHACDGRRNCAV